MAKPKLQDVARVAGVSPTTVSRVLNNRGYISAATRAAVQDAMKQLHYHPNAIARSLQEQKTRLIGVIFPNVSHPFYGELAYRIESLLADADYKVILCNSQDHPELEARYLEMLLGNQVDGVITGAHSDVVANAPDLDAPLVTIDRAKTGNYPNIRCDNYDGAYRATRYLVETGARSIVHVTSTLSPTHNLRQRGYADALAEAGLEPTFLELGFTTAPEVQQELLELYFARHRAVDAVFASNDHYATMVLQWAEAHGMRVPEDFQVFGFDGTPTVRRLLPRLATVVQPFEALAEQAVGCLLAAIDGREQKIQDAAGEGEVLPVSLHLGSTVRRLSEN